MFWGILRGIDSISARKQGKLGVTQKFCSITNTVGWKMSKIQVQITVPYHFQSYLKLHV